MTTQEASMAVSDDELADSLETEADWVMGQPDFVGSPDSAARVMRLAAARLREAGRVQVKPLAWQRYERGTAHYARSVFGTYEAGDNWWRFLGRTYIVRDFAAAQAAAQADYESRIRSTLTQPQADEPGDLVDDERWNAGVNYAIERLCEILNVDPKSICWDAATETVDGDVCSVICNVIRAAYGEEWSANERDTVVIRRALQPQADEVTEAMVDDGYAAFVAASEWQDWDEDEIKSLVRAALLAALQAKSQPQGGE